MYTKAMDYTCVKCTNGKFGDGIGGVSTECQTLCEDGCATCFDAGANKCFTCGQSVANPLKEFYLQP